MYQFNRNMHTNGILKKTGHRANPLKASDKSIINFHLSRDPDAGFKLFSSEWRDPTYLPITLDLIVFQTINSKVQMTLTICTGPMNSAQCYFQHAAAYRDIISLHSHFGILDHDPWCITALCLWLFSSSWWPLKFYESVANISNLSTTFVTNIDVAASKKPEQSSIYGTIMGISPRYHQLESSKSVFLDWFIFTCLFVFITV